MTKLEALSKAIALFKDQDNLTLMWEIVDYIEPHLLNSFYSFHYAIC